MDLITLNNGVTIPQVGLGTYLLEPDDAQSAVTYALDNGYTLIDTANVYVNERAVGRGMRASSKAREEIVLETKLWPSFFERPTAVDETLERLGTDYIDLFDFALTDEDMAQIDSLDKGKPFFEHNDEVLAGFLAYMPDVDGQK